MRNQAFEAGAVAEHPVNHVSAIRRAQRALTISIDKRIRLLDIVESPHEIHKWLAAPIAVDLVDKFLPVSRGTSRIDHDYHVSIRRKQLRVPAIGPVIAPRALWSAMDQKLQGIFLAGIEPRWLQQKALYFGLVGAGKLEGL